jgi:putative nucleotidyltransferase with HDIG domain
VLHVDAPDQAYEFSDVPTDRRVALRLLWLLDDPRAPLDEISRVIWADPALTARVLALANTRHFGAGRGVTTLPRAVSLLGPQTVRSLASTAVLHLFSSECAELPDEFWLHAVTAAVAAAHVAGSVPADRAEAFTAALLHDFGELLLRDHDPQRFDEMARAVADEPLEARFAIERRLFGIDHASLGAQVLSRQGLPPAITGAIREHHLADATATPLARIVRVADCVAKVVDGDSRTDLDATLREVGITAAGDRLVAQAESDRNGLLRFVSDFVAPSAEVR